MAQERQADQMGIAIYENLKGFMLPRRGSVSQMRQLSAGYKQHHDTQEVRTCTAENCRDLCALDIPF